MTDVDMMYESDDDFEIVDESDDDDEDFGATTTKVLKDATNKTSSKGKATTSNKSSKNVEETYQKLSQMEHILKRPDTYIGSVEPQEHEMYALAGTEICKRKFMLTPGLYKIFDEIVVNAADNKQVRLVVL